MAVQNIRPPHSDFHTVSMSREKNVSCKKIMSNLLLCSHLNNCHLLRIWLKPLTFKEQKEAVKGVVIFFVIMYTLFKSTIKLCL